ncbi:MAG: DoxX family protein [bacterium]|nr:DoxX family protein [bacterium]
MFLIRLALAFAFAYVGIASFTNPGLWAGFVPTFVSSIIPVETFLKIHGVGQIILALWLLSGKKQAWSGLVAAAALFGIALFNLSAWDIVFRDVSLGLAALALVFDGRKKEL